MILWWVCIHDDFDGQGNFIERIQAYMEIEQEPKPRSRRRRGALVCLYLHVPTPRSDVLLRGLTSRLSPVRPHNI